MEKKPDQSAAEILRSIENLAMLQHYDILDVHNVRESLQRAMEAFDTAPCKTIADALAFISASRRLGQSIVIDMARGKLPDESSVEAADRYMDAAIAFLRGEEMRREHGHFCGYTLH